MPSLPTVGEPGWGDDLNDFLEVGHTASGSLRLGWGPEHYGLQLWTDDWGRSDSELTLATGVLELFRINLDQTRTVTDFCFYVTTEAGLEPFSAFFGIYGPTGTLIAQTADQKTDLLVGGLKQYPLTVEAGQSLTLTQAWVYAATLIGAGGSSVVVVGSSQGYTINEFLQPADGLRSGYYGDDTLTVMPASFDIEDVLPGESYALIGLR